VLLFPLTEFISNGFRGRGLIKYPGSPFSPF